jgi:hypothetical protein
VTARQVMKRRGQGLSDVQTALYRALHADTTLERWRVIRESEQRALRRGA